VRVDLLLVREAEVGGTALAQMGTLYRKASPSKLQRNSAHTHRNSRRTPRYYTFVQLRFKLEKFINLIAVTSLIPISTTQASTQHCCRCYILVFFWVQGVGILGLHSATWKDGGLIRAALSRTAKGGLCPVATDPAPVQLTP